MIFNKKFLKFYFFTTFIPTILITGIIIFYQYLVLIENHHTAATEDAEDLMKEIDTYALRLSTDLELLSAIITQKDTPYIEDLLVVINEKYPYSNAFYYANTDGYIYLASYPLKENIYIHYRPYFKEVMETKDTAFFYAKNSKLNDYTPTITIATPVFTAEGKITGILIGDVLPTSIVNKQPSLKQRNNFVLKDNRTETIILDKRVDEPNIDTVALPLEVAPWTVIVDVPAIAFPRFVFISSVIFFICTLSTHLLYFILRYYFEKKNLEAEKQRNAMKKLELVGTLAGTFAHEIRNPLTGIIGFVSLLKEKHQAEEDQMYYSVIETELTRINNIVGEFLVLGKPIAVNQKTVDIRDIVKELYPIIELEAKQHKVITNMNLPTKAAPLFCSDDHIKQLILNLSKNAIQALQPNGQLTISINRNSEFIFISVNDNGCGIPEDIQAKLFEPFVTTKKEGTGLGLPVCKQIVDMYKGTIEVDSTVNKGTTFLISFPLSNQPL